MEYSLNFSKIRIQTACLQDILKRVKWLQQIELTETDRMAINAYLDGIEMTQKQIDSFESKMATLSRNDQRVRLLMTIPAINYITALTVSEIVDIRFATPEKLVSNAGLAPSQKNSGESKKSGNITKHGSTWLRYAMVKAAHITIQNDDRIGKFYARIAARRGPQKAKVAAAKEMLVISWHMLTKMEPYRTQNHELTASIRGWNQNLTRPDTVQNTHKLGGWEKFRITSTELIIIAV